MHNTNARPVSWGILGTGKIARIFARGLAVCTTGKLQGVASRSIESANLFADEFDVPKRYQGYEALLADPAIDAVYISLPNHLHAEWTIRCAEAGKHILCEKPLTVNYEEAVPVIEAVRKHDVFMMEAFMYRCHPQTARLAKLIRDGAIGDLRVIQAHFSYNMHGPQNNIRQQNAAAGGGIMDVGCYTASMARLVAGAATGNEFAEPILTGHGLALTGFAHIGRQSRVDEWATAAVSFPGDIIANLTCGIQVQVDMALRIWGSRGHILVPNPWFPDHVRPDSDGSTHMYVYQDGDPTPQDVQSPAGLPLYAVEADTVAHHTADRQASPPCMTWDDSLGNMRTLDAWRKAVGLVFDVERA
jgi:predicted dehydrogenase